MLKAVLFDVDFTLFRPGPELGPVPTQLDNFVRAKLIVRTTLLHARETQAVAPGAAAVETELVAAPIG